MSVFLGLHRGLLASFLFMVLGGLICGCGGVLSSGPSNGIARDLNDPEDPVEGIIRSARDAGQKRQKKVVHHSKSSANDGPGKSSNLMESSDDDGAPASDPPRPSLAETLTDSEIVNLLDEDPASLGPISLGLANAGALFNGVSMPEDERWILLRPHRAFGTQETIDFLQAAIKKVNEKYPDTPAIYIGDVSQPQGGQLGRHLSHQAGRDVDLGWYYASGEPLWYHPATRGTLDFVRSWELLRALITETDVEMMFINRSVQLLLHAHALAIGEDPDWLNTIFQHPGGRGNPIIRHARGHGNHIHVRFYNQEAQEMGRRTYTHMIRKKMIQPPTYYIHHRVRSGETLGHLARRYNTNVRAIQRANRMKNTLIRAGRSYRIPRRGGVSAPRKVVVPPRRIPPDPTPPQESPGEDPHLIPRV